MKSEKAKEYLKTLGGDEHFLCKYDYYGLRSAVELAEREAEERMREKAEKAFTEVLYMPAHQLAKECEVTIGEVTEDAGIDYSRQLFIQKLNE